MGHCTKPCTLCATSLHRIIMNEEIISKEFLQIEIDRIKQSINKVKWKYYHIESAQNFIFHLNNLHIERTRNRMARKINDYLLRLGDSIKKDHDDHQTAKELYPFIWEIADEYRYGLGFIKKPSYFLHLIVCATIFFILKINISTWISFGVVVVIAIITIIYFHNKIKNRKYY